MVRLVGLVRVRLNAVDHVLFFFLMSTLMWRPLENNTNYLQKHTFSCQIISSFLGQTNVRAGLIK